MEFSQPPPEMPPSFNGPPPSMTMGPRPPHHSHIHSHSHGGPGKVGQPFFRSLVNFSRGPGGLPMTQDDFDGKRLRKSVMRKTVDYNAAIIRALEVSNTV